MSPLSTPPPAGVWPSGLRSSPPAGPRDRPGRARDGLLLATAALVIVMSLWDFNFSGHAPGGLIPPAEVYVFLQIVAAAGFGVLLLYPAPLIGGLTALSAAVLLYFWTAATRRLGGPLLSAPLAVSALLALGDALVARQPVRGRLGWASQTLVGLLACALLAHLPHDVRRIWDAETVTRRLQNAYDRVTDILAELAAVTDATDAMGGERPTEDDMLRRLQGLDGALGVAADVLNVTDAGKLLEHPGRASEAAAMLRRTAVGLDEATADIGRRHARHLALLAADVRAIACLADSGYETCGPPVALELLPDVPAHVEGDVILIRAGMRVPLRVEAAAADGRRSIVTGSAATRVSSEDNLVASVGAHANDAADPRALATRRTVDIALLRPVPGVVITACYHGVQAKRIFRVLPALTTLPRRLILATEPPLPEVNGTRDARVGFVVQLKLTAVDPSGAAQDVTDDPAASFSGSNDSLIRVSPDGELRFLEAAAGLARPFVVARYGGQSTMLSFRVFPTRD